MSHVNDTAMSNSEYWLLSGILPHTNLPALADFLNMKNSITMHMDMAARVVATCGTEEATL